MPIPSQYLPVMPYLILKDSKGFLSFVKKVFNATEQLIAPDESGNIMHGEIRIHDAVIMFANSTDAWSEKSAGMYIYVDNVNDVYNKAILEKAISLMAAREKRIMDTQEAFRILMEISGGLCRELKINLWMLYLKN